jgi:phosphate acetyltransferase
MANIMEGIFAKARAARKTITLPEGKDPRTVKAAREIASQGLANVVVLGKRSEIDQAVAETGADLSGVTVIDPSTSPKLDEYTNLFYEMRKAKGVTPEKAREIVQDPLYHGVMMVYTGEPSIRPRTPFAPLFRC